MLSADFSHLKPIPNHTGKNTRQPPDTLPEKTHFPPLNKVLRDLIIPKQAIHSVLSWFLNPLLLQS
jgi:hypothetical protein